jgi:Ser/Thr protein kinase RdoA (MazF antagonist)
MLTEENVRIVASMYADNILSIRNLYGFHNYIYEIIGDVSFVLRVSRAGSKKEAETKSEIDFLLYLKKNNAPIASPVKSLNNQYVHSVLIDDSNYIVSAYEILKGMDFRTRGIDEKERLVVIGRTIGKIHKLSKQYTAKTIIHRRNWSDNPHLIKAASIFANYNIELLNRFKEYMLIMDRFPHNSKSFGLVHGDLLFSNYFFDDKNNIMIFDFDECEYSWYIYDIAVCIYYYLLGGNPKELSGKSEEAKELFYNILQGYQEEFKIDSDCVRDINLFFQMRDYVLLSSILETSRGNLNGWTKDFVGGAVNRLLVRKPFIGVNFLELL